ncbi:MAG: alanine racemase [Planctomycetota bacterium]
MLRTPTDGRAVRGASAWVEVDLDAISHNVRVLRHGLAPGCRLLACVKSDGYGHGMFRVARVALQAGADELVVASVDEGAALREAGITAPILIGGPVGAQEAHAVIQHGLVASLGAMELAEALGRATRRRLPVQIEVDTGMHRHGVAAEDLGAFAASVESRGRLAIAGVYTHLAATGAEDVAALRAQFERFVAAVDAVPALRGVRRHACHSLGAMMLPEAHLDAVRIGGAIYGLDPLEQAAGRAALPFAGLRSALSLKAAVVGLRSAKVGDRVGYGGTFVCERPTRLALLPIGYGDGLCREAWRGAEVLVRGRRAPIVGAISMNQTTIDVTDLPEIVFGEEVVLLGTMGSERVSPADRAAATGASPYEIVALLSPRLDRLFRAPQSVASPPSAAQPRSSWSETARVPDGAPMPAAPGATLSGADRGSVDRRTVDSRPVDSRSVDTRSVDTRSVDTRSADRRPSGGGSAAYERLGSGRSTGSIKR